MMRRVKQRENCMYGYEDQENEFEDTQLLRSLGIFYRANSPSCNSNIPNHKSNQESDQKTDQESPKIQSRKKASVKSHSPLHKPINYFEDIKETPPYSINIDDPQQTEKKMQKWREMKYNPKYPPSTKNAHCAFLKDRLFGLTTPEQKEILLTIIGDKTKLEKGHWTDIIKNWKLSRLLQVCLKQIEKIIQQEQPGERTYFLMNNRIDNQQPQNELTKREEQELKQYLGDYQPFFIVGKYTKHDYNFFMREKFEGQWLSETAERIKAELPSYKYLCLTAQEQSYHIGQSIRNIPYSEIDYD